MNAHVLWQMITQSNISTGRFISYLCSSIQKKSLPRKGQNHPWIFHQSLLHIWLPDHIWR